MLEDLLALKSMPSPVLATVSLEVQLRTALSWVVGELKQPLAAPIFPVSKEVVRSQNRPWMFGDQTWSAQLKPWDMLLATGLAVKTPMAHFLAWKDGNTFSQSAQTGLMERLLTSMQTLQIRCTTGINFKPLLYSVFRVSESRLLCMAELRLL